MPNCQLNYKLISIQPFRTIYVKNNYYIEKLSNILKSEVDTSDEGWKVCGGECGGVCGGM